MKEGNLATGVDLGTVKPLGGNVTVFPVAGAPLATAPSFGMVVACGIAAESVGVLCFAISARINAKSALTLADDEDDRRPLVPRIK